MQQRQSVNYFGAYLKSVKGAATGQQDDKGRGDRAFSRIADVKGLARSVGQKHSRPDIGKTLQRLKASEY